MNLEANKFHTGQNWDWVSPSMAQYQREDLHICVDRSNFVDVLFRDDIFDNSEPRRWWCNIGGRSYGEMLIWDRQHWWWSCRDKQWNSLLLWNTTSSEFYEGMLIGDRRRWCDWFGKIDWTPWCFGDLSMKVLCCLKMLIRDHQCWCWYCRNELAEAPIRDRLHWL